VLKETAPVLMCSYAMFQTWVLAKFNFNLTRNCLSSKIKTVYGQNVRTRVPLQVNDDYVPVAFDISYRRRKRILLSTGRC
jgi:hypothetical protein